LFTTRLAVNNAEQGFKKVPVPALSTCLRYNGTVVFFGLAKPSFTPLIGRPRQPQ
jgi:hypothetical protein